MSTPEGKFSKKEAIALINEALDELKKQKLKRDDDIKDLEPEDSDTKKMIEQNALYQAKIDALSLLVQKPDPTIDELKKGLIGIKKSQESTAAAWAGAAAHYAKKGLHGAANMLADGSKSLIENASNNKLAIGIACLVIAIILGPWGLLAAGALLAAGKGLSMAGVGAKTTPVSDAPREAPLPKFTFDLKTDKPAVLANPVKSETETPKVGGAEMQLLPLGQGSSAATADGNNPDAGTTPANKG